MNRLVHEKMGKKWFLPTLNYFTEEAPELTFVLAFEGLWWLVEIGIAFTPVLGL